MEIEKFIEDAMREVYGAIECSAAEEVHQILLERLEKFNAN